MFDASALPTSWIETWTSSADRAIVFVDTAGGETSVSYDELAERVVLMARWLHHRGVGVGDRVAWLGPNRIEVFTTLLACARLGAIFVPLNNRLTAAELGGVLDNALPAQLLTTREFVDTARRASTASSAEPSVHDIDELDATTVRTHDAATADPDRPLLMAYTSGTTGQPKGAVLTHRAIAATVDNGIRTQHLSADDVILAPLPTFHVGGLNIQTLPTLAVGGTVVLMERFDPELALGLIERHRPTQAVLVPAMLLALSGHPRFAQIDLSCFRGVMSGSSIVPAAATDPWFARGVPVGQIYGTTETGPTSVVLDYDEAASHPGSAGRTVAPTEIRIVDRTGRDVPAGTDGEILIRGPNVMSGYWSNPRATDEALVDGWYHTGDVGHVDEDGWLYVSDRLRDMLISGGENVFPAEVEAVLAEHPAVAEVAVVARTHATFGEIGVAIVVPVDPESPPGLGELRAWASDRLARYKHPRELVVVDSLPRTALGKVTKHVLRAQLDDLA